MLNKLLTPLFAIVFLASISFPTADADIVFGIDTSDTTNPGSSGLISPGSSGTLTFLVTAEDAEEQAEFVGSFGVGFLKSAIGAADVNDLTLSPGVGVPPYAALNDGNDPLYAVNGFTLLVPAPQIGSQLNLFTVAYQVSPTASGLGGYSIDIGSFGGIDSSINDPEGTVIVASFDGVEASLNFQSIPEPSSLALIGLTAGMIGLRRRRR